MKATSAAIRAVLLLSILFGVFSPAAIGASDRRTLFLSPNGDDQQAGTRIAPWATLSKASREARAGDTVILMPGVYEGVLSPEHGGTAEAPITFRAAKRRTAKLVGVSEGGPSEGHAVQISGVSHIHIEGLHIQPRTPKVDRWVRVQDASHIRITDCLMEDAAGDANLGKEPFVIQGSEHVQVRDSVLRQFIGSDMARVYESNYILFEGNAIGHAGHSPLAFSPRSRFFKGVRNVVVRGNVFYAGWGRPLEFFGEPNVLFENNLIINAYHGAKSAGPEAKMMMEDSIVRFNRFFRNWGSPINLGYYNSKADAHDTRWYNNVIDANDQRAIRIETVEDYIFKNNIFSRNGPHNGGLQVLFRGGANLARFRNNIFWAEGRREMFRYRGEELTLREVQSPKWRAEHGAQFVDNANVRPGYVDAANFNHALAPGSPLRDAAAPLTRTTEAGRGTALPVEDVLWFFDGFGIEGEVGDVIAVGTPRRTARVLRIDRERGVLHLSRPLQWEAGEPVSLPWAGAGPDIGVYEHGPTGRVSVQITTEPFYAQPGQPVRLRAVVRGDAEPASIVWMLGDGEMAKGPQLTHTYQETGGYPIRVRMTDQDGHTHMGTAYVDVRDPNRFREPLIAIPFDVSPYEQAHPDFEGVEGNWWWRLYKSRPSVEAEIHTDAGRNGAIYFSATSDNHPVPIRMWPKTWDIDRWPILRFRYRIEPGIPMGVLIEAPTGDGGEHTAYVALAPAAEAEGERTLSGTRTLRDDGQWHEIAFDVRAIREKYPDVQVLRKLRFEAVNPEKIEEGEGYWLDELSIEPGP